MKLRARFTAVALAVSAPLALSLVAVNETAKHRAAERNLARFVAAHLPDARARCEADPASWGRDLGGPPHPGRPPPHHGPPPHDGPPPDAPRFDRPRRARPAVAFAYDVSLRAQSPAAPPLDAALVRSLGARDVVFVPFRWGSDEVALLARTPWHTGPCAYVLARGSTDPSWGAFLPDTWLWPLPMLVVLAAVAIAVGPVIRRVRRLTASVQRSAAAGYDVPVAVEGSDEVADLARAFDVARQQIRAQLGERERRERALREFVSNTTHDVMIPLTVLQGHLAALRDGHDGAAVAGAMQEAHYLAALVQNLATAARLEVADASLQRAPVDLNALVARVKARHQPVARAAEVTLESAVPAEPVRVEADVTLIEQAVSNVVYNAVRYNRRGGHVAIVLEREAGGRFSLRVLDDGDGVPAEELARLTERGYRATRARSRAPEGHGVGLHIASRAAELHGFAFTMRPSEYGGLEVVFEGAGASNL